MNRLDYMTPKELAARYGVHLETVRKWIKAGKIKTEQPFGFRGRRFIRRDSLLPEKR